MREIKFRALQLDVGNWVYGYFVKEKGFWMNNEKPDYDRPVIRCYIYDECGVKYEVAEDSEGQYTGLKDKSGKEIYGGDIFHTQNNVLYIISWNKADCGFWMKAFSGNSNHDRSFCASVFEEYETCEVIGNTRENPELLK